MKRKDIKSLANSHNSPNELIASSSSVFRVSQGAENANYPKRFRATISSIGANSLSPESTGLESKDPTFISYLQTIPQVSNR